jgi:hypothetical protein
MDTNPETVCSKTNYFLVWLKTLSVLVFPLEDKSASHVANANYPVINVM